MPLIPTVFPRRVRRQSRPGLCRPRRGLPALVLALVLWGAAWATAAAQTAPQSEAPPPQSWEDRTGAALGDDIIIEGLGFSKLILQLVVDPTLARNPGVRGQRELLEKNLCWSGLFNLAGAAEDYCAIQGEPSRVDMRLEFAPLQGQLRMRLRDTGPEGLVLFEDGLPLGARTPEQDVIELVNRLTERITGKPGLLGSTIAFVLRQPGRAKVIVGTTTHGERLKLLSDNSDISLLPRWSPDGNILVYTVLGQAGSRVYLQFMLPGQRRRSTFMTGAEGLNSGGTFSPDGKQLALTMSVNRNADLFRFQLSNMRAEQLTSRTGIETQADWSPNGRKIVFVSDRTGTPQVYLLDLETGEDLRVTFDSNYNADPKWSPDGRHILFTKRFAGRDQIYIMDQYGENVRPVTRSRFDAEQPEWAPDGHQIVFPSNRSGEYKLYVVSSDGSGLRRLTNTPKGFEESSPAWTLRRWVE